MFLIVFNLIITINYSVLSLNFISIVLYKKIIVAKFLNKEIWHICSAVENDFF